MCDCPHSQKEGEESWASGGELRLGQRPPKTSVTAGQVWGEGGVGGLLLVLVRGLARRNTVMSLASAVLFG